MYTLNPPIWREPKQNRSRARVDAILLATTHLVTEAGVDGLQIREIALRAGVPVGTVYQFFDDREAILACLAARYLAWQDEELTQRFTDIDSVDAWLRAIAGVTAVFYEYNVENPAVAAIWNAAGTSTAVRELDLASTQRHTHLLFNMSRPFMPPEVCDTRLKTACRLFCELTPTVIRLAMQLPDEQARDYIEEYEAMIRARTAELMHH